MPYPGKDLCPAGMTEEERTDYALFELNKLLKYVVYPEDVACIYMEPVMGEGGYVVPSRKFVQSVREICDKHGILLIFNEIQCGYGRTGKMWASQNFDVVPDIMTVGKAIAGGLPMSAVISTPEIMDKWPVGTHGTTFGGNPCISDVRGIGLMVAIEFSHKDGSPAPDIWAKVKKGCLERHMLTLNCGVNGNGMRFATPLNVKKEEIDGDCLPSERVLATQYGVNRNVIREAIKILTEKKLVTNVIGKGNYVTLPNETDLVDMVESALNTSASCLLYDTE